MCLQKIVKKKIAYVGHILSGTLFGGRPALDSRTVFNAILWILGSGATWRDLPKEYGNWNSIYHKFRKWCELGVFEKILQSSSTCRRCSKKLWKSEYRSVTRRQKLSGGNVHDSLMAIKLLSKVTLEGKKVLADKAFCSEEIREYIDSQKAEACIPDKSNAVVTHEFDEELYKTRNIIERFFNCIKNFPSSP